MKMPRTLLGKSMITVSIRNVLAMCFTFLVVLAWTPTYVAAQDSAEESRYGDDGAERATEGKGGEGRGATTFEPASTEEQVSGLGLMVAAYMAIWVLLIGYFVVLYNRQKRIGKDLDELKLRVEALDDLD